MKHHSKFRSIALGLGAVVSIGLLSSCTSVSPENESADAIYFNGTVIPLGADEETYEAIALKDGVVQKLGTSEEVRALAGESTELIDIAGGTVIPGINDSHFHISSFGQSRPPLMLDLSKENVSSIKEISDLVSEAVSDASPEEWIQGRGWDQGYLEEGRFPTKEDLDAVSPDNPVVLREWSGHAVWANSKALELAGVNSESVAPPGGEIFKNDNGDPSGVLTEGAAYLVSDAIPSLSEDQRRTAVISAVDAMHAAGITSVTDGGTDLETVQLYADLLEDGSIQQRITVMMRSAPADELREILTEAKKLDTDPEWLNVNQVKIFLDGVPTQQKTAWVSEEYEGGGHGGLIIEGDTIEEQIQQLNEQVLVSHEEGFQVGTHATGDLSIDAAVEAYKQAIDSQGAKGLRHYIIHGDLPPAETLKTMSELKLGINLNPGINRSLAHQLEPVIGKDRADYHFPTGAALQAGVNVASSSDAPVVPPRFLEGLASMMNRESLATGEVYGEDQIVDLQTALRTYTTGGAWQDGAESWKGTLEEGMTADLVLLGADLVATPVNQIPDIKIQKTIIGGKLVYESAEK